MATLSFEPATEYYDEPLTCEARDCRLIATVRAEMKHQDDGDFWALCTPCAVAMAADEMGWVEHDGELVKADS